MAPACFPTETGMDYRHLLSSGLIAPARLYAAMIGHFPSWGPSSANAMHRAHLLLHAIAAVGAVYFLGPCLHIANLSAPVAIYAGICLEYLEN